MKDPENSASIQARKQAHLDMCLNPHVRGSGASLDNIHLPYDALFEISDNVLDTSSQIADIPVRFPMMFGAMTGGTTSAAAFNTALRRLTASHGIAMCLGSMRAALRDKTLVPTYGTGQADALFANIGANEIISGRYSSDIIARMCDELGCSGLFVHLNGLQEFVQNGHAFSCSLDSLSDFVHRFPYPVFFKEVGSGLGGRCTQRLCQMEIAGLETASLGGTSWINVEAERFPDKISAANLRALNDIGYSIQQSLRDCRTALGTRSLIASGGISHALDIIKSLAIGADLVAIAQPWYQIYHDKGEKGLDEAVQEWIDIGRLIWRSTGCKNIPELRDAVEIYSSK